MTPDGIPICGWVTEVENLYLAVGMCGQGFMMGPGLGKNIASDIVHRRPVMDSETYRTMTFYRDFYRSKKEALK